MYSVLHHIFTYIIIVSDFVFGLGWLIGCLPSLSGIFIAKRLTRGGKLDNYDWFSFCFSFH